MIKYFCYDFCRDLKYLLVHEKVCPRVSPHGMIL